MPGKRPEKSLFDPTTAAELKSRIGMLRPDSRRHWGTMDVAQMVAHCASGMEMANGTLRPPRKLVGRILGPLVKRLALGNAAPMRRNSPTVDVLVMTGSRDLDAERTRLDTLIASFARAGAAGCTTHPHPFFGPLTPAQWAELMYKHLDHHLRQFGV